MSVRLLALNSLFKVSNVQDSGITNLKASNINYEDIISTIVLKFIDVIEGVAIIALGIFCVRVLRAYFARIETQHEAQRTAINLMEKITTGFLIVISVILGLKIIGLDLTLLLGIITLALSFGLRDVAKNYVAGLLILFKAPFEIGHIVKIRKFTGRVEKIEFQAVTIRTFDQKEVTIHNSDTLTQPIINYSKGPQQRVQLNVVFGYGSDIQGALKIFDAILQNHPLVLKTPLYSIVFKEFVAQGMNVLIRFWVQRPCNTLKIRSQIAMQIQETFDEEKILTPYIRQADLVAEPGMTAARKLRLQAFYGQPIIAAIATRTAEQITTAAAAGGIPTPATVELYADAEEPE